MYAQVEKSKENSSMAIAHSVTQKKREEGEGARHRFEDNRSNSQKIKTLKTQINKESVSQLDTKVRQGSGSHVTFMKQGNDGVEKGLCGYYALCHVLGEEIPKDGYIKKVQEWYLSEYGMKIVDIEKDIEVNGSQPPGLGYDIRVTDSLDDVMINGAFAVGINGHWIAYRFVDGEWWQYDSLQSGITPITAVVLKELCNGAIYFTKS